MTIMTMWNWQAGAGALGTTDVLGSAIRRVEEAILQNPALAAGAVWRVRFRSGHHERVGRRREGLGMHAAGPGPADLAPASGTTGLWQVIGPEPGNLAPLVRILTRAHAADVRPCGCRIDPVVFGHDERMHDDAQEDVAAMTVDEQLACLRRRLAREQ